MKMGKNVTEKLGAKFPVTTRGYSVVKMTELDYTFSEFFKPAASQGKRQSLQQEDKKKKRKGMAKNKF